MFDPQATSPSARYDTDAQNNQFHDSGTPSKHYKSTAPTTNDVAFAALQCLPTPMLVLSNTKTVLLANEAMCKLLSVEVDIGEVAVHCDGDGQGAAAHNLHGLSLSDLGIALVHQDDEAWAGWEVYLDQLAKQFVSSPRDVIEYEDRYRTGKIVKEDRSTPGTPSKAKGQTIVHDVVVDISVNPSYDRFSSSPSLKIPSSSAPDSKVGAEMSISFWTLDDRRHFTLTFTAKTFTTLPSSRTCSRVVPRRPSQGTLIPPADPGSSSLSFPTSSLRCGNLSSKKSLQTEQCPLDSIVPQHLLPSDPSSAQLRLTDQEKLARMKDAVIDTLDFPVSAMWHDASVAILNQGIYDLMYDGGDSKGNDPLEIFSHFKVFTEDFGRELERSEYRHYELRRTQKPFSKKRLGFIDAKSRRRILQVSGDCIFDEQTGEYQAGIYAMTDVTWYTDMIKAQSKQHEQQFQLICETLPQMLWTSTPNGQHDYFSPHWREFTGWTVEELMNMTPETTPFHPDDMLEWLDKWNHCLTNGDQFVYELRLKRHDGVWRWMQSRATPFRDSTGKILKWFGAYTDIHDLVEAKLDAKRIREHLANVIKHAKVTVWAIDKDHILTLLEGTLMWADEPPEFMQKALGQNVFVAFGKHQKKKDWELYQTLIEQILRGEIPEYTSEHQLVEGKGRWYRTRLTPLMGIETPEYLSKRNSSTEPTPTIQGLIGISTDITEAKESDQALKSRDVENMRLLAAEHAAKAATKVKSQFLANMSHEIRTPISGVIGMAELLLDTHLNDEQREWVGSIQRSANGLLTVINDVLDLSKVESGRLDIEEVPFSLIVVVRDVCDMLSYAAEKKNIEFQAEIHPSIEQHGVIMGDPGRIRQILTNLLTNSIKFTSKGFVRLAIALVEDTSEQIKLSFTVEDNGIGIDEQVQKRLFEPFSQADPSTARKFGGTGLGLAICKNLVELMHGKITMESRLGWGTKTIFWLMFHKAHLKPGDPGLAEMKSIVKQSHSEFSILRRSSGHVNSSVGLLDTLSVDLSTPVGLAQPQLNRETVLDSLIVKPNNVDCSLNEVDRQDIRVLIVEDNAINQKIAIKTVQKLGFDVTAVWNGKEALTYLLDMAHPMPHIILMDCQMPVLDGYRTTHLIRHHKPYSAIASIRTLPIIAMTASAIQGDREKCTSAGMDDYLAKPVKGKLLENMLMKWVVEGRDEGRRSQRFRHIHTDNDSICTDPSSGQGSLASASADSSGNSERSPSRPSSSGFPIMEPNDNARSQEAEREEKARSLREDKLLAASDPNPYGLHITMPRNTPFLRLSGPVTPLTFENLSLLSREVESNPFDRDFFREMESNPVDSNAIHNLEYCSESVADGVNTGQGEISPTSVAEENGDDSVRHAMRTGRFERNDSEMTIRQYKSRHNSRA